LNHFIQHRLEIADPLFEQGNPYESRVTPRFVPGYGLFRRAVGIRYVPEGRVNPVQLARLDARLPKFILRAADSTRLDASKYRGLRHSDRACGVAEASRLPSDVPRSAPLAFDRKRLAERTVGLKFRPKHRLGEQQCAPHPALRLYINQLALLWR
jgi:hypothetical protein